MNDFFGFDFVGILILLCILIYLLFDLKTKKERERPSHKGKECNQGMQVICQAA
jgi:hypothetical protein